MPRMITEPLVMWIRWQWYCGATIKMISETYGFSTNCIRRIIKYERWGDVVNTPQDFTWIPKHYLEHEGYKSMTYMEWLVKPKADEEEKKRNRGTF